MTELAKGTYGRSAVRKPIQHQEGRQPEQLPQVVCHPGVISLPFRVLLTFLWVVGR